MTVRIFATDVPLRLGHRPDLARLIPLTAVTWDEAYNYAARLFKGGAVVWRNEGSAQRVDEPGSIVDACQARGLLPYSGPRAW